MDSSTTTSTPACFLSLDNFLKMVGFTVLRQATRVSPARLVAGMRVSLASSSPSRVSKMSSSVMNVGIRAFSGSARRFGSGTSEWLLFSSASFWCFYFLIVLLTSFFPLIFFFAADISLSQKLKEELKYEKESLSDTGNSTPEFLKSFLEKGIWSVRVLFLCLVLCTMTLKIQYRLTTSEATTKWSSRANSEMRSTSSILRF